MKVLVVGKGGREHALAWKIAQSFYVDKLFCFPGNAGIAEVAEIPDIADDSVESLLDFAIKESIDLTVVGPEDYLAKGIVDAFESKGLRIFGVNKEAARLESSKAFAKEVMKSAKIPTAAYSTVTDFESGDKILKTSKYPVVLKADGLAAGKGVIICMTYEEAASELSQMLGGKFKAAGAKVVIEEFLKGEELSLLLLTDGKTVKRLLFSQDHKALNDGDTGLNTGGMGAYTPVKSGTDELYEKVDKTITQPLLGELKKRGINYRGILYIGLMIVDGEPFVLEYNVRFGDPETEPLMFMLISDIVPYFWAVAGKEGSQADKNGSLPLCTTLEALPELVWRSGYGMCVVLASGGYPEGYEKGKIISGLDSVDENCVVFHAGTKYDTEGNIVTDGGRVLMVTSAGKGIAEAVENTYRNVEKITFDKAYFRHDIAHREMERN
ncbi:phosphoribosylamine--glycine ligase [bacterium]|jgi:phosphoribosylamine--glycine ligase|nr:phosphoribosylamine--glycine ligase [bacterium]